MTINLTHAKINSGRRNMAWSYSHASAIRNAVSLPGSTRQSILSPRSMETARAGALGSCIP